MLKDYTAFDSTWTADTKTFGEWKDKVNKGEVNNKMANDDLPTYQSKLDDAKKKLAGWQESFAKAKETCMKNMESCKEMDKKEMSEPAKDDKKADGKKKA